MGGSVLAMPLRKSAVLVRPFVAAVFPDDDLVELDVRDRLGRGFGQVVEVFEHQHLEGLVGAAAGVDDPLQAFALLGQDLVLAAGFGVQLGEDGVGFALGLDPLRSASASASTIVLAFSALAGASSCGPLFGFDPFGLGQGGLGHGPVLDLQHGGLGFASCGFHPARRLRLVLTSQFGLRGGDLGLGDVFALDGRGVGVGHLDTHVAFGVLDLGLLLEGGRPSRR